ncbi:ABC transporter substrate-binding protein [Martelella mangrovi]|uniref:Probable sugar-binding periplasmic protein n=1 Tax=Martelella mangrovi TaxID=1397477 RepID=A0ABV2ICQ3_9HYPH
MKNQIRLLMCSTLLMASSAVAQDAGLKAEVFTSWTSGGEEKAVSAIREEFESEGGEWENFSIAGFENANAALQNRMIAGDPPTVVQRVVGADTADYAEQGLLNPITDVATAGDWAAVMPKALLDYATYDGDIYLVPTGIHGENWMFYSMPAFEKAGITEPPKDWDAFFADMDALKAAGVTPIAWGGQAWQEVKVFNAILASEVGIEGFSKIYADEDEAILNSDGVLKTFEIFGRMRDYVDAGAPGRNWNDATAMVINGDAGLQFMGDWAKGEFALAGQNAGTDFGCALAPASDGLVYISDAFAFPKTGDEEQDKAQKLMAKVVMMPEVQQKFSLAKGSIPVRSDVDMSDFDVCAQTGMSLLAENKIVPEHGILITPQKVGALTDMVDQYWSNPSATPEDGASAFIDVIAAD